MRVLTPADYLRTPWRNGRGETAEIARATANAPTGAPLWRLSLAEVAEDGPFSSFPEYVRYLTVVQGAGMRLSGPGGLDVIARPGETVRFDGGPQVHGALLDGPVRDLNLMVAHDRVHARVRVASATDFIFDKPAGRDALAFCAHGAARVDGPASAAIAPGETLWLGPDDPAGAYRLTAGGLAALAMP